MKRNTSVRRPLALLAALVLVLIGAVAPPASAAGPGKSFSITLSPSSVDGGRTSTITARIANLTDPQGLGSADLTVPPGWIVTAPTTTSGTVTVAGRVVQLRNLGLTAGGSATVSMTTAVPCGSGAGTYAIAAKQANDFNGVGNDVGLNAAASDLVVDRAECTLRFVTAPPSDVQSGAPFAVSVEARTGDGAPTTVPATITLGASSARIGGTTSATTAAGVATFPATTLTAPDLTVSTISASSPGYTTQTSTPVTVHGAYSECGPNVECRADETFSYVYDGVAREATFALRALADPDSTRAIVDQYLVPNPTTADEGCAGDDLVQPVIARFLGVNRALEFVQTVDGSFSRPTSPLNPGFFTDLVQYGGPLKACLTLPYAFEGATELDEQIDGKTAYRGLARSCRFLGVVPFTTAPCIVEQFTQDGDYAMRVALPDSALDPYSR